MVRQPWLCCEWALRVLTLTLCLDIRWSFLTVFVYVLCCLGKLPDIEVLTASCALSPASLRLAKTSWKLCTQLRKYRPGLGFGSEC